jgi:hypothetical protein
MVITPEQRQEIEHAGFVRVEDPETHEIYIVIREDLYERLREAMQLDRSDRSLYEYEEFRPLE